MLSDTEKMKELLKQLDAIMDFFRKNKYRGDYVASKENRLKYGLHYSDAASVIIAVMEDHFKITKDKTEE